jgi:hypothetical protein
MFLLLCDYNVPVLLVQQICAAVIVRDPAVPFYPPLLMQRSFRV